MRDLGSRGDFYTCCVDVDGYGAGLSGDGRAGGVI